MAKSNPVQFIRETRAEASKIVWPTRRETTTTTIFVFILAFFAALFFFLVDKIAQFGLTSIINLFS